MLAVVENPLLLTAALAWTLPWKGAALWKSARRGHLGWFLAILVLNTLALLEIIYLVSHRKKSASLPEEASAGREAERIARRNSIRSVL